MRIIELALLQKEDFSHHRLLFDRRKSKSIAFMAHDSSVGVRSSVASDGSLGPRSLPQSPSRRGLGHTLGGPLSPGLGLGSLGGGLHGDEEGHGHEEHQHHESTLDDFELEVRWAWGTIPSCVCFFAQTFRACVFGMAFMFYFDISSDPPPPPPPPPFFFFFSR